MNRFVVYSAKFAFIAGVNGDPTRQKLLHEAARHFARHGYDGASLRRISEGVGIRAASIYNHFPDGKEELYEHIMSAIAEMLLAKPGMGVDEGLMIVGNEQARTLATIAARKRRAA